MVLEGRLVLKYKTAVSKQLFASFGESADSRSGRVERKRETISDVAHDLFAQTHVNYRN